MTAEETRVLAMAAATDCQNRWQEYECESADCLSCAAAKLLPPLRCACGKFELRRYTPSMWEHPISHEPEACAEPPRATHCSSCKQALPAPIAPAAQPPKEE